MLIPDHTRLIDLTVGQLRQILHEGRTKSLYVVGADGCSKEHIDTIPIEKLSELTGWSKSAIYKKCSKRILPHSKTGKELRFNIDEINDWIKSKKRKKTLAGIFLNNLRRYRWFVSQGKQVPLVIRPGVRIN